MNQSHSNPQSFSCPKPFKNT